MSSKSYLLGHFEALDWRPLQFVDLPSTISCDLCAVIPEKIFRLECYHSLCEGCYQSVLRSNRGCPLDKRELLQSEVIILPIRTTYLQKLEAHCFNFNHGCSFVGSLERLKSHFLKDCEFHALCCKKCCATVLRKDVVNHYMEGQCGEENRPREDVDIDSSVVEIGKEINASLVNLDEKLCAIEHHLNRHTVEIDTTKEFVVNYAQVLRTIQEEHRLSTKGVSNMASSLHSVTEALSSVEGQNNNQVVSAAEIKNTVTFNLERLTTLVELQKEVAQNVVRSVEGWKQCSEKLEAMSKRTQNHLSSPDDKVSSARNMPRFPQAPIGYGGNVAFFHVQDVDKLEKEAKEVSLVNTSSDVFVLRGYSVTLSVGFKQYDSVIHIGVFLHICRGPKDSLLKWPFFLPYTLILVHPTDQTKNIDKHIDVPKGFQEHPESFNRPVASYNLGYGWPKFCKLEDARNGSFVHENAITVAVTLMEGC
ncbi:TNF receptor-associated factor 2-like [Ornithodoros turicata]|uniref:TNF receptor-associated factor 2-like n=1 Tax=Ornithodoros turicata TaxID=34597 RepID=UPI003139F529